MLCRDEVGRMRLAYNRWRKVGTAIIHSNNNNHTMYIVLCLRSPRSQASREQTQIYIVNARQTRGLRSTM